MGSGYSKWLIAFHVIQKKKFDYSSFILVIIQQDLKVTAHRQTFQQSNRAISNVTLILIITSKITEFLFVLRQFSLNNQHPVQGTYL